MAQDLIAETVQLLRARKVSQRTIARETQTSQKWISLLENGAAKNPSYGRLVRVRDFLKSDRHSELAGAA